MRHASTWLAGKFIDKPLLGHPGNHELAEWQDRRLKRIVLGPVGKGLYVIAAYHLAHKLCTLLHISNIVETAHLLTLMRAYFMKISLLN